MISTVLISRLFLPHTAYNKSFTYKIPPQLVTGTYDIILETDYTNTVFEHTFESNNRNTRQLHIAQLIPDLTIESLYVSVFTDLGSGRNVVNVSWQVKNIGKEKLLSKSWNDHVFVRLIGQSIFNRMLGSFSHSFSVNINETYTIYNRSYTLPRLNVWRGYISIKTDVTSNIYEEDETNNIRRSQTFNLLPIYDKLDVVNLDISQSGSNFSSFETPVASAGSIITVRWTVINSKSYGTSRERWNDAIYLVSDNAPNRIDHLLKVVRHANQLLGRESYSQITTVTLPQSAFGSFFIRVDVDHSNNLLWETKYESNFTRKIDIVVPPSPDLVVTHLEYQSNSVMLARNVPSIDVSWKVKNVGNSIADLQQWRDEIVLSKFPREPFASDSLSLGSVAIAATLRAEQSYSQRKTVFIPNDASGPYYIHVIANSANMVREVNGAENNIMYNNVAYSVPMPEKPDLKIEILSSISTNLSAGDVISVKYKVTNIAGNTIKSSWTDIIYLEAVLPRPAVQYTLAIERHVGILEYEQSYINQLNLLIPFVLKSGKYDLFIVADKYKAIEDQNRENNIISLRNISINSLPEPDLQPLLKESNITSQSGEPITVTYNISNNGPGRTFKSLPWTDALLLSEDLVIDPFDVRLASVVQQEELLPGSSTGKRLSAQIPFDLTGRIYYLLLKTDSGNNLKETHEANNLVHIQLNVLQTYSTDLSVSSVTVSPKAVYGGRVKTEWTISNNGSKPANGYKCDSVYLSRDKLWDLKDTELSVDCEPITLSQLGFSGNKKLFSKEASVPLVSQAEYYSIVKTRSNIRDVNKANNIGVSSGKTSVEHTNLQLGVETVFTFTSLGTDKIWRIPNVAPDETLVIEVYSYESEEFVSVYARHQLPATSEQFDFVSGQTLSPNQTTIVSNTRGGDYYVLVTKMVSSSSSRNFTMLAKVAKFEITSVEPSKAAPLGQVTLMVKGTLFPYDVSADFIKQSSEMRLSSPSIYRFSSSELYIIVNTRNLSVGDVYHLQLTNKITGNVTSFDKALRIVSGMKGVISTKVQCPRTLRLGEKALVGIDIQNTGDTDVIFPMFFFSVADNALVSLDGINSEKALTNFFTFLAWPLNGMGGTLPPGSHSRIFFNVKQKTNEVGRVSARLRIIPASNKESNPYLKRRRAFQPVFYPDERWDMVWQSFIKTVGKTTMSLSKRLSKTAHNLGMLGEKVASVDDLIQYELNLADGFHTGEQIHQIVDVTLEEKTKMFPSLRLSRYFSPRVSHRSLKGCFGYGWASPLL